MSITPRRIVNITAGGTTLPDYMAALYADINTNSDWTVSLPKQITTASPGTGSYSFVMTSPAGDTAQREICIINEGTQAAPSLTEAYIGINPTIGDPIVVSDSPWTDAADFSAASKLTMRLSWVIAASGVHTQFIWAEWVDAVCLLHKIEARTYFPHGWHAGNIFVPQYDELVSLGDIRFDGNGILGHIPFMGSTNSNSALNTTHWRWGHTGNSLTNASCVRVGTGQTTTVAVNSYDVGWITQNKIPRTADFVVADYELGPVEEFHPTCWWFHIQYTTNSVNFYEDPTVSWSTRYMMRLPLMPPMSLIKSDGKDVALSISHAGGNTRCIMPVQNGFKINP